MEGGVTSAAPATAEPETSSGHVSVSAPVEVWEQMLAATPRPFFHDLFAAQAHGVVLGGDFETSCQYYPAMRRLVELLRQEV